LKNINQKPIIIIQDYLLDGLNGIEVLKKAKKIDPEIEFLFLSAQDSMDVAVNTMRYGAYDYIVKDQVTFDKLSDKISKILKTKNLQKTHNNFKKFVFIFFGFLVLVVLFFVVLFLSKD
jgi:DNA-binding NtrC family response regulator